MEATFRVIDLDSMIWYRNIEDMTIDQMRARLLKTDPPNDSMLMGSAWHKVLENPQREIDSIEQDGFKFKVVCDCQIILPQIREIRAEKVYRIGQDNITLSGGCDGISGNKITDHKLTFHENLDTYFDSYQWRAYLDIFNADIFEYWIYQAKEDDGVILIRDISSIKMYRYPEMRSDVEHGIQDLLDFVKEYVTDRLRGMR
jgi:hypothetical protein